MKKNRTSQLFILICLSLLTANLFALDTSTVLPESLGKWYKPENKRQVWLHTMFGMRRELQAIGEYVDQKDLKGVRKWSDRFITHYRKLPEMVPEWADLVDLESVDSLESAVQNGELSSIRFNIRQLQKTCRSCHKENRILATLQYRTANFSGLKISTEDKDFTYSRFMKIITRSMNRVRIAAEDEHWTVASDASKQFQLELGMLGKNCATCHKEKEPYERILGATTQQAIKKMDDAINEKNIRSVKMSLGDAAVKICARCHGVHRTLSEISVSH